MVGTREGTYNRGEKRRDGKKDGTEGTMEKVTMEEGTMEGRNYGGRELWREGTVGGKDRGKEVAKARGENTKMRRRDGARDDMDVLRMTEAET
jgi:hypothetical protein